jgi:biopolymer transport protein ExbB/TolQ
MDKLSDILNHGYGAMWVVVIFSVVALAVAVERFIAQWKFIERAKALSENVFKSVARGAVDEARSLCERSPSPIADVFLVGFGKVGRAKVDHVAASVQRERIRVATQLRTRMWMLGTIGATAPFVGLFGTVVGIMDAMGRFKGDETVKFAMVSGPISEALIVTAAGILVAVEAVILFNYFSQRAGRIGAEMKLLTDEFLENLLEPEVEQKDGNKNKKDNGKNTKVSEGEGDGARQSS